MDSDALRRVLDSRAVAACNAAGLEGRVQLMNEEFRAPKDQIYAEFWYKEGNSGQAELGGVKGFERQVGIFQFTLYCPENKGAGAAKKIANLIQPRFNRRQWLVPPDGYLNTLVASVKTPLPGAQNGKFVVIVDGAFHYYYKNPNALPFRD